MQLVVRAAKLDDCVRRVVASRRRTTAREIARHALGGFSSVRLLRAVSFTCSASVAAVYESVAPCETTGSFASIGEIAGPLKLGAGEMKGDATSASGSAPAGG